MVGGRIDRPSPSPPSSSLLENNLLLELTELRGSEQRERTPTFSLPTRPVNRYPGEREGIELLPAAHTYVVATGIFWGPGWALLSTSMFVVIPQSYPFR